MVCDSHGRNYKLGDPIVKREHGYLQERDVQAGRETLGVNRPQYPILSAGWLVVGHWQWEMNGRELSTHSAR